MHPDMLLSKVFYNPVLEISSMETLRGLGTQNPSNRLKNDVNGERENAPSDAQTAIINVGGTLLRWRDQTFVANAKEGVPVYATKGRGAEFS